MLHGSAPAPATSSTAPWGSICVSRAIQDASPYIRQFGAHHKIDPSRLIFFNKKLQSFATCIWPYTLDTAFATDFKPGGCAPSDEMSRDGHYDTRRRYLQNKSELLLTQSRHVTLNIHIAKQFAKVVYIPIFARKIY